MLDRDPKIVEPSASGNAKRLGCDSSADTPMVPCLAPHGNAALKPWQTLQARAALEGFKADIIDSDDGMPMLVVSRWSMTRSFSNLAVATAWVAQVDGRGAEGGAP